MIFSKVKILFNCFIWAGVSMHCLVPDPPSPSCLLSLAVLCHMLDKSGEPLDRALHVQQRVALSPSFNFWQAAEKLLSLSRSSTIYVIRNNTFFIMAFNLAKWEKDYELHEDTLKVTLDEVWHAVTR